MVLTAHGSADPRSAVTTHAVADQIRRQRPGLDVRVAFCENAAPNLRDVLTGLDGPAVVTPLLLASAFHARVDIPAIIADAGADVLVADTLGEDPRLVRVLRQRLSEAAPGCDRRDTGVLVVAVGSSHSEANAATDTLAAALAHRSRWAGVRVAYATGPAPSVTAGIDELRELGAKQVTLAPWFVAHGLITDRIAAIASAQNITMAEPLGAHRLVAATVLDRFDQAVSGRVAA